MGHLIALALLVAAPLLAGQPAPPKGGASNPITTGALLGLMATWIGILLGYLNIRRSMRADRRAMRADVDRAHEQTARRVAKEEIDAAMSDLMNRREQEEINKKNDERYALLLKLKAGSTLSE